MSAAKTKVPATRFWLDRLPPRVAAEQTRWELGWMILRSLKLNPDADLPDARWISQSAISDAVRVAASNHVSPVEQYFLDDADLRAMFRRETPHQ